MLYTNVIFQTSPHTCCGSICSPTLQMRTQRLAAAKQWPVRSCSLLGISASMGPLQEVCPNVPPSSLCPCSHELLPWAPGAPQHDILDCTALPGTALGPLPQQWPSLTWQKPDLVAMFLHCVPLLQPGPAIMKIDDQRGLEEVCGAQGRRERGRCL